MMSKTPKFDQALGAILKDLIPGGRICRVCNKKFWVEKEDINFYNMFRVPPPTQCPRCRSIRRLGVLMREPKFFKRQCGVSGHAESIITIFPPSSPHKVYDNNYWWSDGWEATSHGRQYEVGRNFFDQFRELFFEVPHLSLDRDATVINSEYSLGGRWGKNNYYCVGTYKSEDCLFADQVRFSRSCVDCSDVRNSEFCYACVGSDYCNRCIFVIDSNQCLDSAFLYDCKNCNNCFLSSNLRNKSYIFENKQLTREEYHAKVSAFNLGDRNTFHDVVHLFDSTFKNALHRSALLTNTTNCVGDRLANCKDCFCAFDGNDGENLRFVQTFAKAKDSIDSSTLAENSERLYETVVESGSSNVLFNLYVRSCVDLEYSSECSNCQNCFGCVGLKNKKFYILNKLYSEEAYWQLIDQIKSKMLADGEYGELFPLSLGLFPYQSSKGQKFYPLDAKSAAEQGVPWYEEPESRAPNGIHLRSIQDVPSDIKKVDDSIMSDAIRCETTGRPFKITLEELKFYRHMNLPLPTKHPWQRIMERTYFEHSFELFPFSCPSCGEKSSSIYSEEQQRKFKIFCEKCYIKEII